MKKMFLFLFMISCTSLRVSSEEGVFPVAELDPVRYQGLWYEVASIPTSFQKKCFRDVSALYTYDAEAGLLKVLNSCTRQNAKVSKASGLARVNPKLELDSQLQVTFVRLFGIPIWQFGGDYWVLSLDSEYQVSLVGGPDRDYAWILARTPSLSKSVLEGLKSVLLDNEYDPCSLVMTRNSEQDFTGEKPNLCQFLEN